MLLMKEKYILNIHPFFVSLSSVMGRILSIDYGAKRTGLAVTDTLKISANPLATVPTASLMEYLSSYFATEQVEEIVIGAPRKNDNTPSENMARVEQFVRAFKNRFPDIPLNMYDERYTSVLAHRAMIDGGLRKKARRDKAMVDRISAVILLQNYLESKQYKSSNI